MDGIFTLIVIIGIANVIIKWVRKQAAVNQKNQGAAPENPWQRMMGDMTKTLEDTITGKPPEKVAPTPVYKTLKTPVLREEGTGSGEGEAYPGSIADYRAPYIVGGETAASPYSLAGQSVSKPQEPVPMRYSSLPGKEESAAFTAKAADMRLSAEPGRPAQAALSLAFNRDSLMQAVVMHEILTRPQDNRRRRWKSH